MKLRNALIEDLEQIISLHQKEMHYQWEREHFIKEFESEFSTFMVLTIEDKIIGYFVVRIMYEQMDLMIIHIDNQYQKHGYGQFILEYIYYLAIKNNCENIILEVYIKNYPAINFYEKNGFNQIDQRNDYYEKGNHALIYTKQVNYNER